MRNLILSILFCFSLSALADTPPPTSTKIKGGTDGTLIGNTGDSLKVTASFSPSGTQDVNVTNASIPVTGTFFQATQPVSALSWPLPTGAATAAGLTLINTTLGSPFQVGGSIGNTAFGISGTLPAFASTPTFNLGTLNGAATAANQVLIESSLTSIDGKLTSLGQKSMANSMPVVLASDQSSIPVTSTTVINATGSISNSAAITTTASTFTAPANAVGFILEAESGNTANIRWAVGSTATASVGNLAEPGRDTGYIPLGANISVIAMSGTQSASVQWVLR